MQDDTITNQANAYNPNDQEKPSFKEAFFFWLKLGFISFGGPAGQIAIMHEFLVKNKKWISNSKFLHALNYCMILPGPEAQQLATYVGWMIHGRKGGLAAGLLFVIPSMFILLFLSSIYVSFGNVPWIMALFDGLKPAIIAIVILALIKIGKKSLRSIFHYIIALGAFLGIFFFKISFPIIIVSAILTAIILRKLIPSLFSVISDKVGDSDDEEKQYFINKFTNNSPSTNPFKKITFELLTGIILWIIPFFAFYYFARDFEFWQNLIAFFTKAAFVTFGGAYAVLPYVAQVSVEKYHWLSSLQMIDGLALGETTPGPLVMVLVFVGFMAGYNNFGGSLAMGALGLLTTTFYTFLPCFLFIFIGGPLIEKTQNNKYIKEILTIVTAAVVGVILNLCIYLAMSVIFTDGLALDSINYLFAIWVIISIIALYKFNVNMIFWIIISAIFGLINFLVVGFSSF